MLSCDHLVILEVITLPKQTFFNLDVKKRKTIESFALEEFSTHSFNEASVNTIIKKSKISKGSLYQYFDDKVDLYLYLIEISAQVKLEFLKNCEPNTKFDDFFEGFTQLMIKGSEFDLCNPLHSKLLYHALNGPLVDKSLEKMKALSGQYLLQLLKTAVKRQQLREDVNLELMVFFLNTLATEFAKYAAAKAGVDYFGDIYHPQNINRIKKLDLPMIVEELMKLIKDGLAPVNN